MIGWWWVACRDVGSVGVPPPPPAPVPEPTDPDPLQPPCEADLARPPGGFGGNVVVILLDDVGTDKLSGWGHPDPVPTPTLDGLSDRSIRFTAAYSDPSCSPTRASLLTGRRPRRHGVGRWISPSHTGFEISDDEEFIPEMLSRSPQGPWSSAVVGKWHLSLQDPLAPSDPLRQGFDHHLGTIGNPREATLEAHRDAPRSYFHWERNVDGQLEMDDRYLTSATTDDAIDQLGSLPEPFFLYVPYNAAHEPWHAPPPELYTRPLPPDPERPDLMDAMVEALDTELGRLIEAIDETDTTVILLSDNGSDASTVRPPYLEDAGYKQTVYEGGVNVPMWAFGAAVTAPGTTSPALVYVADLFATVADLAGVDVAELDRPIDGVSLVPLLSDPHQPWRPCLVTEVFPVNGQPDDKLDRSIRDGAFALVHLWDGPTQLYDLTSGQVGPDDDLLPTPADLDDAAASALADLWGWLVRDDRAVH